MRISANFGSLAFLALISLFNSCSPGKFGSSSSGSNPPATNTAAVVPKATPTPIPQQSSQTPVPQVQPVGPGSELTLTITDSDSKLTSFQVRNAVSSQWIPLTWSKGTQTIPNGCLPSAPTTLSLQMTSSRGPVTVGTCSAPLQQTAPNAVSVSVDPGCTGSPKASFVLGCAGSSALQVTP